MTKQSLTGLSKDLSSKWEILPIQEPVVNRFGVALLKMKFMVELNLIIVVKSLWQMLISQIQTNLNFFVTLDNCDWLNGKHTIFGKVAGNTIYNALRMGEVEVADEDRPVDSIKILKIDVVSNPFDDIVPRYSIATFVDSSDVVYLQEDYKSNCSSPRIERN